MGYLNIIKIIAKLSLKKAKFFLETNLSDLLKIINNNIFLFIEPIITYLSLIGIKKMSISYDITNNNSVLEVINYV